MPCPVGSPPKRGSALSACPAAPPQPSHNPARGPANALESTCQGLKCWSTPVFATLLISSPSLFFLTRPPAAPSAMHQQAKVWRPIWSRTERFTMNACYKRPSKLQKAAFTIRNCSTRSFFVSLPVRCCKYGSSPVCAWWLLVLFHINPAYLRWLGSALCSPFTWHFNDYRL